ncbi:bi-domain-containing oxidoreductase [Methylosinus sp. H3A]|uniref:bi-domain-containing oxidoreductase n=1 Tax=Methylosinus sp. H3A TaxID=2785786 RepID=UPI0018C2567E|nr:bi-domain-containing oxidoreductase [Methylosinus sp. H3A]MBG0812419.1 bi-domain-containing oxidoreductase [Methylosinus sp. H3A]
MKQVEQNYRTGELRVAEVPAPRAIEGGVLVATRVSLISSGTEKQLIDLAKASLVGKAIARPDLVRRVLQNVGRDGLRPTIEKVFAKLDTPIPLGYSLAGEVVDIGRRGGAYAVGDRIACAGAGQANHAEFNAVPKHLTAAIPAGIDDEDASFVTLGSIALQGVRLASPTLGERVVVMGLGLLGLLTVQLLKANGCRVLGFDPNPARAKLAEELGADVAVSDDLIEATAGFTNEYGADAVIVTASSKSNEPINLAAEISRLKGRIVIVGMVGMTIDREPFYKRELELKLSLSYGPGRHDPAYEQNGLDYPLPYVRWTEQRNMEAFLALVADGKVTPKRLVTHRFSIAQAEKAYELLESDEPHLAILITYPEAAGRAIERRLRLAPPALRASGGNGVAFLGFGNYAQGMLLPALRKAGGATLTTVVTATGVSARRAAEKHGFAVSATEPAAALEDNDTDTVFIATRHDTHASFARDALRSGKHVFCEKPLAIDSSGLTEVLGAAEIGPGVLTVGFNRRFAPLLQKAKAALEPRTGALVMLYRINAGAIPADSWIQREEGAGRVIGEVCHFVDALTFLSGSLPIETQAIATRDHADAVSILVRFADGSSGTIVYSSIGDAGVPKEYIEVFAGGRVIQLDDFRCLTVTRSGKRKTTKSAQNKGQHGLVSAFLEATRGKRETPIPLAQLVAVTEATFAIEESLRIGAPVAIPASRE